MVDGWLNLVKFITSQFGLPGSLAVGIAGYLIWLLQKEREAHAQTRNKIDEINEKRIEFTKTTIQGLVDLKEALDAVTAILGKKGN